MVQFSRWSPGDAFSLYQYRHRYYHGQLGRFGSRDPIGYEGSQWSLYEYVHGSPLAQSDAFGLQLSQAIGVSEAIAAGWTAEEIAAAFGMSIEAVKAAIAAYAAQQAIEKLIENYEKNSKGSNPCEKARDAVRQAEKSIRGLRKWIEQHEGWIRDPSTYPGVVRDIDDAKRHWRDEIKGFQKTIDRNEKALEKLREIAYRRCWCLFKPSTWFR